MCGTQFLTKITKVMIAVRPLKEEKEGGEEWLKELLSPVLELLGKTGKAEASLLHHLAPAGRQVEVGFTNLLRKRHSWERF